MVYLLPQYKTCWKEEKENQTKPWLKAWKVWSKQFKGYKRILKYKRSLSYKELPALDLNRMLWLSQGSRWSKQHCQPEALHIHRHTPFPTPNKKALPLHEADPSWLNIYNFQPAMQLSPWSIFFSPLFIHLSVGVLFSLSLNYNHYITPTQSSFQYVTISFKMV